MNRKWRILIFVLVALTLTGCMTASFSGNYVVNAGTTLQGDLFVTSGNVMLEDNSKVTGTILLTSGTLRIGRNAQVGGNVVLTSGDVYMDAGSEVHGDVILSSQDIYVNQAPGSRVDGQITTNIAPYAIGLVVRGVLLFCVLPIAIIIVVFLLLGVWLGRITKRAPQVQTLQAASVPVPAETPVPVETHVPAEMPAPAEASDEARSLTSLAQTPVPVQAPAPPLVDDTRQKLQQLKSLLDEGLITQTDYEAKKADILSRM